MTTSSPENAPILHLASNSLASYQRKTYRSTPGLRLKSKEEAVSWVIERGFVYFWPIKDVVLPSLWVSVAGDRPVAEAHDDPGHVTWGWKDSLLGSRQWYYAKVLRKKATIISFLVVPYFYALSENFGSPEDDYLTLYEQGRLTRQSKVLYETLLVEGPLDTIALRRATNMASRDSDHRFNRALAELQADFKILPVAVTQAGGWRYAFVYDLVHRRYPDILEKARDISTSQARQKLTDLYFRSIGAAQKEELVKLFGWSLPQVDRAVDELVQLGILCRGIQIEGQSGEQVALCSLVETT